MPQTHGSRTAINPNDVAEYAEGMNPTDPFIQFKKMQKQGWSLFAPMEIFTMPSAATLVDFAEVKANQRVLDCACGTGVVAITAALKGAKVKAMDLAPVLLERARTNATMANVEVEFKEGDVEELPYQNGEFDVVLSQYGHMFAPRPEVTIREMLRVLKPGGRIAFSTWPPDHFVGKLFSLVGKYVPAPAGAAPAPLWGDPNIVSERLNGLVKDLEFDRSEMRVMALSLAHARDMFERATAPLAKLVMELQGNPEKLSQVRNEIEHLVSRYWTQNAIRQHYLLSRAIKL